MTGITPQKQTFLDFQALNFGVTNDIQHLIRSKSNERREKGEGFVPKIMDNTRLVQTITKNAVEEESAAPESLRLMSHLFEENFQVKIHRKPRLFRKSKNTRFRVRKFRFSIVFYFFRW